MLKISLFALLFALIIALNFSVKAISLPVNEAYGFAYTLAAIYGAKKTAPLLLDTIYKTYEYEIPPLSSLNEKSTSENTTEIALNNKQTECIQEKRSIVRQILISIVALNIFKLLMEPPGIISKVAPHSKTGKYIGCALAILSLPVSHINNFLLAQPAEFNTTNTLY